MVKKVGNNVGKKARQMAPQNISQTITKYIRQPEPNADTPKQRRRKAGHGRINNELTGNRAEIFKD